MPEGDTIHRTAATLHKALAGRALVRFEAPRLGGPLPLPGTRVEEVEAHGKHCLIRFGDGTALRTHMRMTGSWHLYRPGERWRKRPGAARVVLEVGGAAPDDPGWVAVCFAAPDVELTHGPAATAHLGPDLCTPGADVDDAVRRLAAYSDPERPIGDALLDQRVACGIGNVYRCEVLFLEGLDPATPVAAVDTGTRRRLLATAHRLLLANLGPGRRVTWGGGHAVYGRAGEPCPRCAAAVRVERQGRDARLVWWCPGCQARPGSSTRAGG